MKLAGEILFLIATYVLLHVGSVSAELLGFFDEPFAALPVSLGEVQSKLPSRPLWRIHTYVES
jgi:hypothetical protein